MDNNNNKEEKTSLIPLPVNACKIIAKVRGGIFWRQQGMITDTPLEVMWLVDRTEALG